MGNQVVIEPYLDAKQQLQWRVLAEEVGSQVAATAVMKAEQFTATGIFKDFMPAVGGGALAAFTGAVADKLLGGLGGGIVGNFGKAIPRLGAAWALHQWAPKQWHEAKRFAVAFLIYDAAKSIVDIDGIAKGFGVQLTSGFNLGGLGRAPATNGAAPPPTLVGDPLTAGWV